MVLVFFLCEQTDSECLSAFNRYIILQIQAYQISI